MTDFLLAFRPHYAELRTRLGRSLVAVLLCAVICYLAKDQLTAWCMCPLQQAFPEMGKLVYTSLPEALVSYLKLALICGIMLSFPYLLLQFWLFVSPGLLAEEQHRLLGLVTLATLLFVGGAAFAFFVVLPQILHYFLSFAGPELVPMLKLGKYLTFIARMALAFALAFEIPFLMVVATRSGLAQADYFCKKRLHYYLAIAVLAFLLAAGDFTATALLCLPLIGLYETGQICCRLAGGQESEARLARLSRFWGWIALLGSALFFYLATVIMHWGADETRLTPAHYTLGRFVLGLLLVSLVLCGQRRLPRFHGIRGLHALLGRAVANAAAVFCFFKAVELGTVAEANILNMTYPVFVAILAWFTLKGQRELLAFLLVAISTAGIWLILGHDLDPMPLLRSLQNRHWSLADYSPWLAALRQLDFAQLVQLAETLPASFWGLSSGLTGGIAIVYLSLCRRDHDPTTILFYLFAGGAALLLPLMGTSLFLPSRTEWLFLIGCSLAGVLAQYLLTCAFRYVTAVEGSVISSSRILMAGVLGPFLVADPALGWRGWLGAGLIFIANVAFASRRPQLKTEKSGTGL